MEAGVRIYRRKTRWRNYCMSSPLLFEKLAGTTYKAIYTLGVHTTVLTQFFSEARPRFGKFVRLDCCVSPDSLLCEKKLQAIISRTHKPMGYIDYIRINRGACNVSLCKTHIGPKRYNIRCLRMIVLGFFIVACCYYVGIHVTNVSFFVKSHIGPKNIIYCVLRRI